MDVEQIRRDFPILQTEIYGGPLVYLDNAATTQIPMCVMDRITKHYMSDHANVHRGIHYLSEQSTIAYENARKTVQQFIHANLPEEVIFTSGTTDSIHLVAKGLEKSVTKDDRIVVTQLEHHSNFLPWMQLCKDTGATLAVVPCPDGELDMAAFCREMERRPKIVAITQVSNLTGTVMPLKEMIFTAKSYGAIVLVDGAQGIRHEPCDMQDLECDFYCFSGHKIMAPTGIGVLYGNIDSLRLLTLTKTGGGMVDEVHADSFTYGPLPSCLEAGTPNFVGAIALAEALTYITKVGREEIARYEAYLMKELVNELEKIPKLTILGHPKQRAGAVSFVLDEVHAFDVASIIDKMGVAVRSGTHCAQPGLKIFHESQAVRISPAFYNTREELDVAISAIYKTMELMSKWTKR